MPRQEVIRRISKTAMNYFPGKVLDLNSHPNSLAGLISLKRFLFRQNFPAYHHSSCKKVKKRFLLDLFSRGLVFCFKCNKLLKKGTAENHGEKDVATVDHIVPISKASWLSHDKSNMRASCASCNNRRANK